MFYVYLFAVVFGGVLLAASIFFGEGHDGDAGEAHLDIDDAHGAFDGLVSIFASLRFWTFFCFCFGALGAAMSGFGWANTTVTLASSVALGAAVGIAATKTFRWVSGSQSNSMSDLTRLAGMSAEVVVTVSSTTVGKIRVRSEGRLRDMLAKTIADETIAAGQPVQILSVVDGVAHVARPKLGLDEELELRARDQK